jgi:phosphoribosyl-AMP cyclohydrolase
MGLPLCPRVESLDFTAQTLSEKTLRIIGQLFVPKTLVKEDILKQLSAVVEYIEVIIDGENLSPDQVIQLLDGGVAKVVLDKSQLGELSEVPVERILVRLSDADFSRANVSELASRSAGVVYSSQPSNVNMDVILNAIRQSLLPSGGQRVVYREFRTAPTLSELKPFAENNIIPVLPISSLTSTPKSSPSLLPLAQISLLGAKTDRPDGLFPTIVVDERNHALGLVYSSAESVAETLATGQGVYQSRQRGLWYKGATSGATQQVLSMTWDCDSDCLRFTVTQSGKGPSPPPLLPNDRFLSPRPADLFRPLQRLIPLGTNAPCTQDIRPLRLVCRAAVLRPEVVNSEDNGGGGGGV